MGLLAARSTAASAQAPPGILVVRAGEEDRALAEALAERILDGALLDERDLLRAPPPVALPIEPGWLARATLDAEDRFARFELASAAAAIDEARARLDRDGPRGVTTGELVELFLLDSRVAEARGDTERAARAARQALSIDPELVVDLERHPPTLAALIDAQRAVIARCPLRVGVHPVDAAVEIDGRLGAAPMIACGEHWVTVSAAGYLGYGVHFTATPGTQSSVEVELEIDAAAVLASPGAPFGDPPPLLRPAARTLGREVVLCDVAREGDALVVAVGERRVRAPGGATVDELLSLLRAAGRTEGGFDVGLAAGIGVGAAAVAVALITTIVVVATSPAPTTFELRGQILP